MNNNKLVARIAELEQQLAQAKAELEAIGKQVLAYQHFIHSVSNLAGIGESVLKLDFRKLSKEELDY